MTTYLVEGRRFGVHLHAVTFAHGQAQNMGRAVHVKAEVTSLGKTERKWLATMYPPDEKRTLLRTETFQQEQLHAVAV